MIRRTTIDQRLRVADGQIKADAEIVTVNEFSEASAKTFATEVSKLIDAGQQLVPVVVDSYGGDVYALLSMIDTLDACGVPVLTFASGKAMSCGAVLLACGTRGMRFAAPSSTIMLHEVSSVAWGKNADIKADAAETERLNTILLRTLDERAGRKKGYFAKLYAQASRVDLFLSPQQARKHGLIDGVGTPSLQIDVTCDVKVGVTK
jgi:ATP-dependent Clp protease, protease subunit